MTNPPEVAVDSLVRALRFIAEESMDMDSAETARFALAIYDGAHTDHTKEKNTR